MERPAAPTVDGRLLFVSAPTSRCGTTLVQRLLNSSRALLVFGEGVGAGLIELSDQLQRHAAVLARAEEHRRDLERALSGEQFWCPHLMGDARGFVELFAASLQRFVRYHEEEARGHGRGLWGAKLPTVTSASLLGLRRSLPGARLVYVTRDLVAAARSAKARRFLVAPEDFRRFAQLWCEGARARDALRADPAALVLSHEELVGDAAAALERLAAFAGVSDLDPAVLRARVNTWTGAEERGHAPQQYLSPGALDPAELEILERERATLAAAPAHDPEPLGASARA